jgi:hypothetical protein
MMWLLIAGCFLSDTEMSANRIPLEGGCWENATWVGDGWYWWAYGAGSLRGCDDGGSGPMFYADGYCWDVPADCGDDWMDDPSIEATGERQDRCWELDSVGHCR